LEVQRSGYEMKGACDTSKHTPLLAPGLKWQLAGEICGGVQQSSMPLLRKDFHVSYSNFQTI
jgi:hypothetical protein